VLALLIGIGGMVGCVRNNFFRPPGPAAPVVLQGTPTAQQIVAAVNANTARVNSYYTTSAKFTVPGMAGIPMLRGNIALERPLNFRLTAGIALTGGDEIDMGSNSELMWLWVRRNDPAALFFCRHDQFANSGARQVIPIDPTWIGDALGLVQLNPAAEYQGPVVRPDGHLELRSPIASPSGPMTRVIVVDATRAWVIEQHLYNSTGGAPVASAIAEDFRYDETVQVSLPRRVTIRMPASDLALTIDVGQVALNVAIPNPAVMWSPPALEDYPRVDLGTMPAGMAFDPRSIPATNTLPPVQPQSVAAAPVATPPTNLQPVMLPPTSTPSAYQLPPGGIALEPTNPVR
jgi:hypothetical protein